MLQRNGSKLLKEAVQGVDVQAFAAALRKCSETKSLSEGRRLHQALSRDSHDHQTFLGNLLVHMYGCCDSLQEARLAFENIHKKNVFSWNIIIAAYAQRGDLSQARSLFEMMSGRNVVTWNSMAGFYSKEGCIDEAKEFYGRMPQWDVVSWNLMIAANASEGHSDEASRLFVLMAEKNIISWNAIVTAYSDSHKVSDARKAFDRMPAWNIISWSAIITAYAQHWYVEEAKLLFQRMPQPDVVACTAMIVALGESGDVQGAKEIFDGIKSQDVISWSMMISVYAQNGHTSDSIYLFLLMDLEGVAPDSVTYVAALEAYGNRSCHTDNRLIHAAIVDAGLEFHPIVSTALMYMYGKSGSVSRARKLFDQLPSRDVVTWNTMMVVYAHNGYSSQARRLFYVMIQEGVYPDHISFISVLSAASHAGLLYTGWEYFVSLTGDYGLTPSFDHFICMVDLLGRAARLADATELMYTMPFEPDAVCWRILLCACRSLGDEKLGDHAADNVIDIDHEDGAPYFLLGHTYAANGKLGNLIMFNRLMTQKPLNLSASVRGLV